MKKTFLIMRIIVFLLLVTFLQTNANSAYAQHTKLSMNYANTSLENILDAIEDQSEFFFLYNEKLIDVNRKVSVHAEDQRIEEVLNQLFTGTNIQYSIIDRKIVLASGGISPNSQQQRAFSGIVSDRSGAPLPGVTVVIKGTTQGTITGADGNFSLANVLDETTLVVSFVGMKTQEISVSGKTTINVVLEEETIGIEEVVAIGYGVQKKSVVTAAISRIATDELDIEKPTNVQNAIKGKVFGVQITSNSGQPGSDSKIYIRGIGTVNDASPLYVIDGMPSSNGINYLNPSDIASIEILKDAASAAIYGARGANGVVLVTTKSGSNNQQAVFNYEYSYGVQNPEKKTNLL
ncbi:MAG: TonB-dependent receptor plug domain-containing protein, partial [Clostridiaceae bacterium]|nr:TonB-dependent receptor plug domain-containing protein [Clostridiaceae bacterium]